MAFVPLSPFGSQSAQQRPQAASRRRSASTSTEIDRSRSIPPQGTVGSSFHSIEGPFAAAGNPRKTQVPVELQLVQTVSFQVTLRVSSPIEPSLIPKSKEALAVAEGGGAPMGPPQPLADDMAQARLPKEQFPKPSRRSARAAASASESGKSTSVQGHWGLGPVAKVAAMAATVPPAKTASSPQSF